MSQQFHFCIYIPPQKSSRDSDKYLHTHINGSIFPNSKKVNETTISIIDKWVNKICYIYTIEYYSLTLKINEIYYML